VQHAHSFGSVQELTLHCKDNSVHELEATELASSLEPADWKVPSGNYLKDLSQTGNRNIRQKSL
jgi:hypothetical protein